jgi:hypothetical protein
MIEEALAFMILALPVILAIVATFLVGKSGKRTHSLTFAPFIGRAIGRLCLALFCSVEREPPTIRQATQPAMFIHDDDSVHYVGHWHNSIWCNGTWCDTPPDEHPPNWYGHHEPSAPVPVSSKTTDDRICCGECPTGNCWKYDTAPVNPPEYE